MNVPSDERGFDHYNIIIVIKDGEKDEWNEKDEKKIKSKRRNEKTRKQWEKRKKRQAKKNGLR